MKTNALEYSLLKLFLYLSFCPSFLQFWRQFTRFSPPARRTQKCRNPA